MTVTKQLITALLIVLGVGTGLVFLASPARVAANATVSEPEQPAVSAAQIEEQAIVLAGDDFKISQGNNARSPEIKANNTFAALVYSQDGQVWLRSARKGSGWGINTLLAANGAVPKLAFRTGSTNTLYVVWEETTTIRFRRCTLADPVNVCSNPVTLANGGNDIGRLRTPDIAVGGSQVYVAWVDRVGVGSADNVIRLARSTNNGQTWTTSNQEVDLIAGDDAGQPALAATGTHVHLAYKDNNAPWSIEYRRFPANLGASNASKSYFSGSDTHTNYQEMSHPAIAVNGAKVYLLWDNNHAGLTGVYSLTGAQSSNSGATWGAAKHIPSQAAASGDNQANQKSSKDSGPPVEEAALLPSVTLSGANFAAVWQEKPQDACQGVGGNPLNDTSEVYFTPNVNSAGANWGTLANNRRDYAIDPDVAVDNNGTHVAFMKDELIPNCGTGGETSAYGIFYRGPFNKESDNIKRILLPILNVS